MSAQAKGLRSALRSLSRSHKQSERGAAAVMLAVLLVALLSVSAVVVDLADARVRVRGNQLAADLAGLAAGSALKANPAQACADAWTYLKTNLPDLPSGATSPCDSGFPTSCVDGSIAGEYQATGAGPYQITFVYPVPDGHAALDGRSFVNDGDSCERFAVIVRSFRSSFFGGIVGSSGLTAPAGAVVRAFEGNQSKAVVALLLLDPIGCESDEPTNGIPPPGPLLAVGQGGVKVFGSSPAHAGFIGVDSNGTESDCNAGAENFTIDAQGGGPRIWACGNVFDPASPDRCDTGGAIQLYAMAPGQVRCDSGVLVACHQRDVNDGKVKHQPVRLDERLTRAPVDHRYNCKTSYPNYVPHPSVPPNEVPIAGCTEGTPPHIDQLRAYVGTDGLPDATWQQYSGACDTTAAGAPIVVPPGNWWVNCPEFIIKKAVTFQGGNVIFQGRVNLTSQGELNINTANPVPSLDPGCLTSLCPQTSSASHAWVYIRNDAFVRSGGAPLRMRHAMMYIHDEVGGRIHLTGGSGAFIWIAPTEGPFDDLLLWSESQCTVCASQPFPETGANGHFLAGQAGQVIEGVFFTPMAPFEYAGQGSQDQAKAQFLTYRLLARGQGALRMAPDPDRAVLFPISGYFLIR